AMDAQRREFTGNLRRMIMLRDNICRTPYCGAPIRHVDHATPYRQGGPTSYANGSGLCERCNYTKEHPGWTHQTTPHDLEVTTPTGHHYTSRTRPLTPPPRHATAPPGTPQATPPTGTPSPAPTTSHAHEPGSHPGPRDAPIQTPDQPAVPCTTDTSTVTVKLPSHPAATAAGILVAQHRGFDLAWPLRRHGTPGTQVEYARAA
ncbi:HNH endonuclease, partial [Citricoccus sp. NPDC055426]|uniref:HNH endonuclease n=1 Tax=Citricoccus sp. NPDC055426 TaxID=3155536 RepID=UPI003439C9B6